MANEIEALIAAVADTGRALERGETIYKDLNKTVRRMRITMWIGLVGLVADLALSVAFGLLFHNQDTLNNRVSSNQAGIHQAECDLNSLFVQADTPSARAASTNVAQYDAAFHTIYVTRAQLGCQPPIAEPARP